MLVQRHTENADLMLLENFGSRRGGLVVPVASIGQGGATVSGDQEGQLR